MTTTVEPGRASPTATRSFRALNATAGGQTFHVALATGVVLGLSMVTNIVAAHALTPSQRGMLAAGLQAAYFSSSFLLFGVEKSLPIVANQQPMSRTIPLIWRAVGRRCLAALGAGLAISLIGLTTDLGAFDTIAVFAFPTSIMAVATAADAGLRAVSVNGGRSQLVLAYSTGAGLLILATVVALTLADNDTVALWLIGYGICRAAIAIALHLANGRPTWDIPATEDDTLGHLRSTGRRLWPASFANFAAFRSDRLLLPVLGDTASLGIYVVVATLTDVLAAPTEALANVMTPRWRTAALTGRLRTFTPFALTGLYLGVAVAGLSLAGPWLVELLFGARYRPSGELIIVLAFASSLFGINRLLSARATALGATSTVSMAETAGMATAVVGYLALIPGRGATGAAMGSLLGYSVTAIGLLLAGRTIGGPSDPSDPSDPSRSGGLPTAGSGAKRAFDVVASLTVLVLAAPLFIVAALGIRVFLGSPVLFRQTRTGLGGQPFEILKFRTMLDRTDEDGNPLPDDQRTHWFGQKLRRTSIDELPTLVNVLRGEMSLVGPRPLLHRYLPRYNATQLRRFEVRPGLTGLAQIAGRNTVEWGERLEADVRYVDERSLTLDLQILWSTVALVVGGTGADGVDHTTEFMGTEPAGPAPAGHRLVPAEFVWDAR